MTPRHLWALILAFGTAFAVNFAVTSSRTRAADGDKATSSGVPPAAALAERFETTDQAELLLLLDELGPRRPDAAKLAQLVGKLLAVGQSDAVTDHALASLGRLGAREARESVANYLNHRRAETRARAYAAFAQLADKSDAPTLALGLRDSAPEVRATVARALGDMHAHEATPLLLRALTRGVTAAAGALGKCGDAASVAQYTRQLGKQSLDVMLEGYANYLAREELPESVKLDIVAALENVSGAVVKRFLVAQLMTPQVRRSQKLQRAITACIARIKVEGGAAAPPDPHTEPAP